MVLDSIRVLERLRASTRWTALVRLVGAARLQSGVGQPGDAGRSLRQSNRTFHGHFQCFRAQGRQRELLFHVGPGDTLVISWQRTDREDHVSIEQRSGGALEVDDSALYQALHRIEDRGYIVGEWGVSQSNRRARYYHITASGRQQLKNESARLLRYASALSGILTAARA